MESFLPQDFRLSMLRYYRSQREAAFAAEVEELVAIQFWIECSALSCGCLPVADSRR